MKKTVYSLGGEDGLVDTINKLIEQGYTICPHGTHKIGIAHYVIDYSGEAVQAIEKVKAEQDAEPDWNEIDSIVKKADLATYFKDKFDIDVSPDDFTKKEMIEEFKSKLEG